MLQDLLSQINQEMKKAVLHLEEQISTLRTGRAHGALVETVMVQYYGASTPLKELATIQVPDASSILIQAWDPKALSDIEQAIRESDLGLSPTNDGRSIRLSLPPLTSERRAELVKILHKMGEEARVTLRTIRKDTWDEVQKQHKAGDLTEDEKYQGEEQLNKVIDTFNGQIQEIVKKKESDIVTI